MYRTDVKMKGDDACKHVSQLLVACCKYSGNITVIIVTITIILPNIIRAQIAIFVHIIILDLFQLLKQLWVAERQVYLPLFCAKTLQTDEQW